MSLYKGFVYLHDYDDSIKFDIRYATSNNFIGRPLAGYQANVCIVTKELAKILVDLQAHLKTKNLELMIYESYRPQRASEDILQWCQDLNDQKNKLEYYPNVDKCDFYQQQYILHHSGHTRGSTLDLTLLDRKTDLPLNMGSCFDFFGELSHPGNKNVPIEVYENRQYLQNLMQRYGFTGIHTEWWHFTLDNEPFPDTYFDFPVK